MKKLETKIVYIDCMHTMKNRIWEKEIFPHCMTESLPTFNLSFISHSENIYIYNFVFLNVFGLKKNMLSNLFLFPHKKSILVIPF